MARVIQRVLFFLSFDPMNLQKLLLTRRFFSTLAFFSVQTVFLIYLQSKGLSNSEIAFSLSLLFFSNQALSILAGIWGDRYGLAKMMLLGCFLDVIAYIFFLSADNYLLLLIATTCFGFYFYYNKCINQSFSKYIL